MIGDLYRGYVQVSKNKNPVGKYKDVPDDQLLTLEEAVKKPGYGGVLKKNVVMIDVDNMEGALIVKKSLHRCKIHARITKTSRGMHFTMFCNNPLRNISHLESLIGVECDYKYGINSTVEVLKISGEDREVLEDPKVLSTMPAWLYPIDDTPIENRSDYSSIVGMSQGSRDQTLFTRSAHNLKRSKHVPSDTMFNPMANMTKQEWDDMIHIINDYVFADPLPENEIQKFLSQDSFDNKSQFAQKTQKKGKHGVADAVTDMMEACHVRQFGKALYRKDSQGCYKLLKQTFIDNQLIYVRGMDPEKSSAATKMIRAYLDEDKESDPWSTHCVGFRNGVMDWSTGKFVPYSEETDVFIYFDVDYLPGIDSSYIEGVLLDWCQGDKIRYQMLLEMVGACLYRGKPIKKWWVIEGKADTGKSTFIKLLRGVLGEKLIGSVAIQHLKDSNAIAELVDKSVNIVDDGSSKYASDLSPLRQIIEGTPIQIKLLYQDKFTERLEARMVFVFNEIPDFKDDNGATAKKMMVIGFNRVYAQEEKDTDLLDKLITEENRSALVKLAVEAMRKVMDNNLTFTVSAESKKVVDELVAHSDQFCSYAAEIQNDDGSYDWDSILGSDETGIVYDRFVEWAKDEGYSMPISRTKFTRKMCKLSGYTVRKSNGKRFFRKDEDKKP